jgi:uncharacterized protein (DUF885 family)
MRFEWTKKRVAAILAIGVLSAARLSAAATSENARLNEFLDAVFERRLAESPEWESELGRKTERQGRWDDPSDAAAEERIARVGEDLTRLRVEFDREKLDHPSQLSYDLFVYDCELEIANHAFRDHAYVVDQFNGQLSGLLTVLQNNHAIDTIADAEAYVSRLVGIEGVLTELARQLRHRAENGVIPPAFSFPDVIADATAMSSGAPLEGEGENALWSDFREKLAALDAEPSTKVSLAESARLALTGPYRRGFEALLAELRRLQPLAPENRGVWSLPRGEAYYANRIVEHTTLELSAEEVHAIGLSEVARIQEEMRAIQQRVGVEGDLSAFFEFIRTDPDNYYEDSDAGRERFLEDARQQVAEIYDVVGEWFHRVPEAGLEVRRVEPWRENSVSIAFYNSASQDGSRPGVYYANLGDMPSVQKYVFTAITYHESVPGHHFQIALAQELDGLPMLRRFGGYGAYIEGWALYGEKLAREMGFYADPLHDFGRLQNELWRAVRLVLDTGIHAMRWSRERAIAYFRENTPLSEGNIVTEVERYFVNPGQALSYKMGMLEILRLREKARRDLGGAFDIRDFHEVVLGSGSMPLPVLEAQVERYIAAELESGP